MDLGMAHLSNMEKVDIQGLTTIFLMGLPLLRVLTEGLYRSENVMIRLTLVRADSMCLLNITMKSPNHIILYMRTSLRSLFLTSKQ